MHLSIRYEGQEREIEVPPGVTIAEAARRSGIPLFGTCHGQGLCCQCSRRVREGIDALLTTGGEPYPHNPQDAPYVKACLAYVERAGVSIDGDSRARGW